ncbi:MAG: NTP transferase domain-containing protein [Planctomycetes bacterium]|nr:NTP transferase domain-containing protein [Planctomycetota bacterium]
MKAVILCGGKGTRIRGAVADAPKPLLDIAGRPLVHRLMDHFAESNYNSFILCLGHRGSEIRDYFDHADVPSDWNVELVDTGEETMTGGRLWQVRDLLQEPFFLCYGDALSDVDLSKLVEFHSGHGKIATLTTVHPRSDYGLLDLDGAGCVRSFREKDVQQNQWINAGFFVMDKAVFEYLNDDVNLILERQPLEKLTAVSELMAFKHDGFWKSMETYRDWLDLDERFRANS